MTREQQPVYKVYRRERLPDGLLLFEYRAWRSEEERRENPDRPWVLNNHKAMVRETHQRRQRDAEGWFVHVSGEHVRPQDAAEFVRNDERAHRWQRRIPGPPEDLWEDDQQRTLKPFKFPSYFEAWKLDRERVDEELDPQWEREVYTWPESEQVDRLVMRALWRFVIAGRSGDLRGTTLNVQVGASGDDTVADNSGGFFSTVGFLVVNDNGYSQARFTNITIPNGATINSTFLVLTAANVSQPDTVLSNVAFEDADNPGQVTDNSDFLARLANVTSAVIAWDNIADWTVDESGPDTTSPDQASSLQEIVNRPGFSSGNSINDFWYDDGTSDDGQRAAYSYDGDSASAPELDIDYTSGPETVEESDTFEVTLDDAAQVEDTTTAADTLTAELDDATQIEDTTTASDTLVANLQEDQEIIDFEEIAQSDTLAAVLQEAESILEEASVDDTLAVDIAEAESLEDETSVNDSLVTVISDDQDILEVLSLADLLHVVVLDDQDVFDATAVSDTLAAILQEDATLSDVMTVADTLVAILQEAQDIPTDLEIFTVSDVLAAVLDEDIDIITTLERAQSGHAPSMGGGSRGLRNIPIRSLSPRSIPMRRQPPRRP